MDAEIVLERTMNWMRRRYKDDKFYLSYLTRAENALREGDPKTASYYLDLMENIFYMERERRPRKITI